MRYLILGPAGMGIFAQLGALKRIESTLDDVEAISGSSAGAIIGFLLAIGMSVDEITKIAIDIDMRAFVKVSLGTFFQKYGFVDTALIREQFVEICGCDPTFEELDKKLYVSAFCLNDGRTEYFSRDTHPKVRVIDAVIASMSIPVIFSRSILNGGRTYVDGATVELVPMAPFYDKKPEEIAIVCIRMKRSYTETINDPRQFFECLIRASLANRISSAPRACCLMEIDVGESNIFDFNMDFEHKIRLYNIGYESQSLKD